MTLVTLAKAGMLLLIICLMAVFIDRLAGELRQRRNVPPTDEPGPREGV